MLSRSWFPLTLFALLAMAACNAPAPKPVVLPPDVLPHPFTATATTTPTRTPTPTPDLAATAQTTLAALAMAQTIRQATQRAQRSTATAAAWQGVLAAQALQATRTAQWADWDAAQQACLRRNLLAWGGTAALLLLMLGGATLALWLLYRPPGPDRAPARTQRRRPPAGAPRRQRVRLGPQPLPPAAGHPPKRRLAGAAALGPAANRAPAGSDHRPGPLGTAPLLLLRLPGDRRASLPHRGPQTVARSPGQRHLGRPGSRMEGSP